MVIYVFATIILYYFLLDHFLYFLVETDTGTSEVPLSVEEQTPRNVATSEQTLCEENELTGRLSQLTLESHNSQQTSGNW